MLVIHVDFTWLELCLRSCGFLEIKDTQHFHPICRICLCHDDALFVHGVDVFAICFDDIGLIHALDLHIGARVFG
ncbi:hypothetical protein D3C86_1766810 [compost metagenome]